MGALTVLLVVVGAAVGAPLRYLTDHVLRRRLGHGFPWGTMAVNITGSAMLGMLTGTSTAVHALLATGFCGALTTYSTFSYETVRLIEDDAYLPALANVLVTVVAGVGAAALGYWLVA